MDVQPGENFFEITLSQEGSQRLLSVYKKARWLFAGGIILSAVFLVGGYLGLMMRSKIPGEKYLLFKIETVVNVLYVVLGTVLTVWQLYVFFHFTRLCRKSIQLGQSDLFNYSFRWLVKSAKISIAALILQFCMTLFSMYVTIYFIGKMPAS